MVFVQPKDQKLIARTACTYALGSYQVFEKWPSYRAGAVMGLALTGEEVRQFARAVRRITEILCMGLAFDAVYAEARDYSVSWLEGYPAV